MSADPTLDEIIAGLHERYATVDGIAVMLDYEPRAIQKPPLVYTLLDNQPRATRGELVEERTRFRSRLCISWVDPEAAEASVRTFTRGIPRAVDAAPRLGGRARDAFVEEVDAGWALYNQVEFRVVDFYVSVLVYAPLGG